MKIDVLSKDTIVNIFDLVTYINKSSNMTALVLPEKNKIWGLPFNTLPIN